MSDYNYCKVSCYYYYCSCLALLLLMKLFLRGVAVSDYIVLFGEEDNAKVVVAALLVDAEEFYRFLGF